jgi:hypothetical protein
MIFKPAKRRIVFTYFLISLAAFPILGIWNVVRPMTADWFISALVLVVVAPLVGVFWSFFDQYDYAVTIRNGQIMGSNGRRSSQVIFSLEQIDKARTTQLSWWQRLSERRYIWSMDGQRVVVLTWYFSRAQVRKIFELAKCQSV